MCVPKPSVRPTRLASPLAIMNFSCLAEQLDATLLTGAAAQTPLKPGQMLQVHGVFEDGTEAGGGIFLVFRSLGHHCYLMAPFGSAQ